MNWPIEQEELCLFVLPVISFDVSHLTAILIPLSYR